MLTAASGCTRSLARPAVAAPRASPAVVAAPRSVVVRSAKDGALKLAGDLLGKGLDMAKNADKEQLLAQANALKGQALAAVNMSAGTVKDALDTGLAAWATYDKDNDGKLSISEAVNLLNGPEISGAIKQATGLEHTKRTEADIAAWFKRADFDNSGTLSKREFSVMYAGVLCEKAGGSVGVLSNALLSAVSADGGDGKIEVKELKNLMGLVGLLKK